MKGDTNVCTKGNDLGISIRAVRSRTRKHFSSELGRSRICDSKLEIPIRAILWTYVCTTLTPIVRFYARDESNLIVLS